MPRAESPRGDGGAGFPAWTKSVSEVEAHYDVKVGRGLSAPQVAQQRARWGFNELDKEEGKPLWKLVLEQFDDPLVKARAAPRVGAWPREGARQRRAGCCASRAPRRHARMHAALAGTPRGALTAVRALRQILLVAAAVSFGISYAEEEAGADPLSKFIEPGVIVLILVLNATVGVWMARAAALRAARSVCAFRTALLRVTLTRADAHAAAASRRATRRARWTR